MTRRGTFEVQTFSWRRERGRVCLRAGLRMGMWYHRLRLDDAHPA
ncbi:MAG: hypothetical protein ACI364_00975 [Coriobacteriales bacterium]